MFWGLFRYPPVLPPPPSSLPPSPPPVLPPLPPVEAVATTAGWRRITEKTYFLERDNI